MTTAIYKVQHTKLHRSYNYNCLFTSNH